MPPSLKKDEPSSDGSQEKQTPSALSVSVARESSRWGAAAPMASWLDLYARVAANSWICVVQSNWCRLVNFLRMTGGKGACASSFVDLGMLMLVSPQLREKYCVVGKEWPTKPFSNGKAATKPLPPDFEGGGTLQLRWEQ